MKNIIKGIVSVALIGSMMMSFAGCTKFEAIRYKDFVNALEEEAKLKESSCNTGKNSKIDGYQMKRYIVGTKGNCNFVFYEFDEESDAVEMFEIEYDIYVDSIEDGDFEGSHKEDFDEDSATGYVLFDGENTETEMAAYCALFLKENTIVMVTVINGSEKDLGRAQGVLDAIGYPKP